MRLRRQRCDPAGVCQHLGRAALTGIAGLIVGCSPTTEPGSLPEGVWRAEITQSDSVVPFNFHLRAEPSGPVVHYENGDELLRVEEVHYDPGTQRLELLFPSYSSGLIARVDGERMSGEVYLTRRTRVHRLPFSATFGQAHRFFDEPAGDYADISGRWEARLQIPQLDADQPGVALFEQHGPYVTGTVYTRVGDYRFLAGEIRGSELYLSTFDGNGSQLWRARLDSDGMLDGFFDTVTYGEASWSARRNPAASLDDPTTLTYLKTGVNRFDFSFPDFSGNTVSLSDPRYAGKVVLVIIAGSWCPTCHDEAVFMAPFYAEHRDRGLEVVYLMFEYSDDLEEARPQLEAFRKRYGIEHEMLFAGDAARASRSVTMPMLNDIIAFPTTIFVDRSGEVRRIHTAFPGPAMGAAHEEYKREFAHFVDQLLDETS